MSVVFCGYLLGAVVAGHNPGYLPAAGPTPLRFGPDPSSRPRLELPPLAMHTPPPVDPEAGATNRPAADLEAALAAAGPGDTNVTLEAVSVTPLPPDPYTSGLVPPPEGGWWRILISSNSPGATGPTGAILTTPLGFLPPTTSITAPPSRATYSTTP